MADYKEFDQLIGLSKNEIHAALGKPDLHYLGLDVYVNSIGVLYVCYAQLSDGICSVNGYALFSNNQKLLKQVGLNLVNTEDILNLKAVLSDESQKINDCPTKPVAYIGSGVSILVYITTKGTMFLVNIANKTTNEFLPQK